MIEIVLNPSATSGRQMALIDIRDYLDRNSKRVALSSHRTDFGRVEGLLQVFTNQPTSQTRIQFAASTTLRDFGPLFSGSPSVSTTGLGFSSAANAAAGIANGVLVPNGFPQPQIANLTGDGVWTIADTGGRFGVVGIYVMADRTYRSRLPRDTNGLPVTPQSYATLAAVDAVIAAFPATIVESGVTGVYLGALVIRNGTTTFTAGTTNVPAYATNNLLTANDTSAWVQAGGLFGGLPAVGLDGTNTTFAAPFQETAPGANGVWRLDLTNVRYLLVRAGMTGATNPTNVTPASDIRCRLTLTRFSGDF